MLRKTLSFAAAAATAAALLVAPPSHAATTIDACIDSVPEPDGTAVKICYSIHRPDGASAETPVPMVFHSHGWGGSRTKTAASFAQWLDNGFGVISFDQRGFGESGGKAHVENPAYEGKDVQGLVDVVAGLEWVAQEAPGDPVLGAIGGSYGGGYQFVGAFSELLDRAGETRFDALAPEITWWDLRDSLAPSGVPRTAWVTALYAAGADAHTNTVHQGFAYGAATGEWPVGQTPVAPDLNAFFEKNGPAWHVANGRVLDIPVLFGQGLTDNLFNLNQGLKNYDNALTPEARAKSIFVGYNGGHALPSAFPTGTPAAAAVGGTTSDACSVRLGSTSFSKLALRFMQENLQGLDQGLTGHGEYHLATPDGGCVTTDSIALDRDVELGTLATTAGAGAPVATKVADGPLTVAGMASVTADVTSTSTDSRTFFALAVGTSPADAKIIQNNMLPLRKIGPAVAEATTVELPGIAVEVPAGQSLFLMASPVSDMSFGHGSRVPGAVLLENTVVHLPVV